MIGAWDQSKPRSVATKSTEATHTLVAKAIRARRMLTL